MLKDTVYNFKPEAIIIDAGSFPSKKIPLSWLERCDRIVCCDGAADSYLSDHDKVWRIVGDCDSLSASISERYHSIVRRFPDQDTNDQTKAVRYLARKGIRRIVILGATGLREDHTLGNLSLLTDYLREGIETRAYTDYGVFIPCCGNREFRCPTGTQVSVFNFGATGMKSEGLRYPIRDFSNWWQGTLNETTADRFRIYAEGQYMIFLNYSE